MSTISTALSKRLGLRYPIVSAPMFIISNKEMIVAAAEAGILGSMPSLNARTPEELRETLAWIRRKTDKPFAINLTIKLTDPARLESDFQMCLEFGVPVIITSYGNPAELARRAHEKGVTVFHDVIHLKHAKKAEQAGADAIIGVASGAGGHAGTVNPYVLYPWLAQNLKVPVIAAGCIATGRQLAASLALGAELAYMGTRFIASTECGADARYKESVINGSPDDLVYTDAVSGVHANFLRSTLPAEATGDRSKAQAEIQGGGAKRWRDIWSAGQGIALATEVKPIAQIVQDIVREYGETLRGLPPLEA
ncbi:MAG: Dioxygenase related to 2-nitropropane dioxygenase [Labilithrix sp.]|nr:Dioxygenase related to 2-nitropropane dioxygenase [Labilithrix sp.]